MNAGPSDGLDENKIPLWILHWVTILFSPIWSLSKVSAPIFERVILLIKNELKPNMESISTAKIMKQNSSSQNFKLGTNFLLTLFHFACFSACLAVASTLFRATIDVSRVLIASVYLTTDELLSLYLHVHSGTPNKRLNLLRNVLFSTIAIMIPRASFSPSSLSIHSASLSCSKDPLGQQKYKSSCPMCCCTACSQIWKKSAKNTRLPVDLIRRPSERGLRALPIYYS